MVEVLFEDETTALYFIDKQTTIVFVCFNSLAMNEPHLLDFYSLSKRFSMFFIMDKTNSWGNNIEWDSIASIINPVLEGKQSYSIGVSMGGTNSVISSNYLNTDIVIAFNPQYTIHPDVFPDSEYRSYANKIKKWKHIALKKSFKNKQTYYTFVSCQDKTDVRYLDKYPQYVFNCGKNFGHNLAFDLKNAGLLAELLSLLTEGPEAIEDFVSTKVRVDKDTELL